MYRSFEVTNFRCFQKLKISELARVNLIAGVNNIGKTAFLEALFLHCGAYNPELTLRLNAFRGVELVKVELGRWAETPWESLFYEFDASKEIELNGENEKIGFRKLKLRELRKPEDLAKIPTFSHQFSDKFSDKIEIPTLTLEASQVLELECIEMNKSNKYYMIIYEKGFHKKPVPPPPPFPAIFLAARIRIRAQEDSERFGKLEIVGKQNFVLKALRILEPRLNKLSVVVSGEVPTIHGDIGMGRLFPLPVMGEGMARLASLLLAIGNTANGVVMVDEIENGLHHSILPKVWAAIAEAAREFNAQVFATTHSLECIEAAHKAFRDSGTYDFLLHRLERIDDSVKAITYDQETLEAALETGLEVR